MEGLEGLEGGHGAETVGCHIGRARVERCSSNQGRGSMGAGVGVISLVFPEVFSSEERK